MKVLEVTDPNFVVNKDFTFIDNEGTEILFYEDDYLDIKTLEGKLVINDRYIVDNPSNDLHNFDDYVEPVDSENKQVIVESTTDRSKLVEAKIVLK